MLIPEDLTVKELKVECLRHTICDTCKYEDSCAATDPSRMKIDQNYPKFTGQEIGVIKFYYEREYKKIWCSDSSIVFEDGGSSLEIPMFLMPHFLKENNYENKFDIQQYLDWYESNHD